MTLTIYAMLVLMTSGISDMSERVIITRHIVGICHMQVCAVKDATEEEILSVCNYKNPSGTSFGWAAIDRKDNMAPVQCADDPERMHYMVYC